MNTIEQNEAQIVEEQAIPSVDVKEQARIAAEEGYPFLFSVVIAVYNAEDYVEETIESVVGQTLGFEYIQLVLVDDGSTDNSASLCTSFAKEHPDNVVFVSKENGGVSSARNTGISLAKGKYYNFLDSDDLWSPDAFEWALQFFVEHPDIVLTASKYVNFGRVEGDHRLNYKFETTKVVDLLDCYDYPQLSSSTCFFLSRAFENRRYNEELSVSEDVLLVNDILLDELKYGVMSEPVYHYRQREDRGSAVDTMKDNVSWYLDTPRICYQGLFELSRQRHGNVLPFIQYTVMYDLQWRVRAKMSDVMQPNQIAEYRALLVNLLGDIEDHIISEQKTISIERVAYSFSLKYQTSVNDMLDHMYVDGEYLACALVDGQGVSHNVRLRPITALSNAIVVEDVESGEETFTVCGFVNTFRFRPRDLGLFAIVNNMPLQPRLFITDERKPQNPFNDDIVGKTGFELVIPMPLGGEARLSMTLSILGTPERVCHFRFDENPSLPEEIFEGAYAITPTTLVQVNAPDALVVRSFSHELSESELAEEREKYESYVTEMSNQ